MGQLDLFTKLTDGAKLWAVKRLGKVDLYNFQTSVPFWLLALYSHLCNVCHPPQISISID
ncbi:MAG: hypothetical protein E2P02_08395 [Acidobacteria bacterium]|nr:MAG: hypothetical protein E2P02_08395 [Acidobacteriota bacterium]